ncbi:hypothetical protein ACWXWU_13725 [Shewanella sp. A14]
MSTRTPYIRCYLLTILILLISQPLLASDLTDLIIKEPQKQTRLTNDNANTLPPQYASDHQGNVIIIPTEPSSALEYQADDIYLKPSLKKSAPNKTKTRSSRAVHPAIEKTKIANDPSCRWLNSRLKHLKKKRHQTQNHQFSHYQDEIDIRQQEWKCLKCASTGPTDVDRNICQPKR